MAQMMDPRSMNPDISDEDRLYQLMSQGSFGMEGFAGYGSQGYGIDQRAKYLQDTFGDQAGFQTAFDRYKQNDFGYTGQPYFDPSTGTTVTPEADILKGTAVPGQYHPELERLMELERERNSTLEAYDPSTKDLNVDPLSTPYGGIPDWVKDSGMFTDLIGINRGGDGIAPPLASEVIVGPQRVEDVPQLVGGTSEFTGSQREAFEKYKAEQAASGGAPNLPRSDDNPGGYTGMQRATLTPQYQGLDNNQASQNQLNVTPPPTPTPTPFVPTTGSSLTDASSNDIQRMLNRGTIASNDVSDVQGIISSPQPVTITGPAPATVTDVPSGIMSQAPSSMTDPGMMGMMQSPMQQNSQVGSYTGGMSGYGGGGMSGYGGMGTGMSAGGGIMSMANPMQQQMSMMPQQMMQQGGYAPPPQTLSYGQSPFSTQSLYGSQTGSSNNQQNIYGQQQFNSPFAGASRGYYA